MINNLLLAVIVMVLFIALYIVAPKLSMLLTLFIVTFVATAIVVFLILSSNCTDPARLDAYQWLAYAMGIVVASIITKKAAETI